MNASIDINAKPDGKLKYILLLSVIFFAIHSGLAVHDYLHPESFLMGDRAVTRLEKIEYFLDGDDIPHNLIKPIDSNKPALQRIVSLGNPGDYVILAIFYSIGGKSTVILSQVALQYISVIFLYGLSIALGQRQKYAFIAAVLYMFLPGSLMQPHTLVSEGIYNPLIIIFMTLLLKNISENNVNWSFIGSIILLAAAISIRTQLALFPLFLCIVIAIFSVSQKTKKIIYIIFISYVGLIAWILLVYSQTGTLSMGESDHGLGYNLFGRIERMASIGGFALDPNVYADKEISVVTFFSYICQYPGLYMRTLMGDLVNTLINPGINAFAVHYLGVLDSPENWTYWKDIRDQHGLLGVVAAIVERTRAFSIIFFLATLLWVVFGLFAIFGLFSFVYNGRCPAICKAILIGYLIYGLTVIQLAIGVRWTHRTPVEFIIAILFAQGLEQCMQWRARRRRIA